MSTNYEPTPEQVEQMLREIRSAAPAFRLVSPELARVILQRQHEREGRLLNALKGLAALGSPSAIAALAAHAALDAPPQLTLLEAAKAMLAATAPRALWSQHDDARDALKAAVERAERAK